MCGNLSTSKVTKPLLPALPIRQVRMHEALEDLKIWGKRTT
jgi:hypothetical protein